MQTMRDAFFDHLFPFAKKDPSIMILTSDFSAPAFDRYRLELPGQFVNTGIAEQNTILVASGLALSGMKVFVVSIAPFITMRCFEQIRLFAADMNLDVSIVGVGAGLSYAEAGATHHSVEDIGLMRLLPNIRIFSPSGNAQVRSCVERIVSGSGPHYVRLDRRSLPELYPDSPEFGTTLQVYSRGDGVSFLATGFMTHAAVEMADELRKTGLTIGVVDALSLPMDGEEFRAAFADADAIVSLEEHVRPGGLGEAARDMAERAGLSAKVRSFFLDVNGGLCHSYGSRESMHSRHGMGRDEIMTAAVKAAEEITGRR